MYIVVTYIHWVQYSTKGSSKVATDYKVFADE